MNIKIFVAVILMALAFMNVNANADGVLVEAGGTYTATGSPVMVTTTGATTANGGLGGSSSSTTGDITANGGIGGAGGLGGNASLTTGANTLSTGASTSQGGSVGDLSTGASTSTVGNLTTGSSTSQGGSVGNLTTTSQGGSVGDLSTGSSTSQGGTSTAQGGSSSSSGNTSGNATITTNYIAAKIPVSSAYAPANYPTATCMGSSSLGATGVLFGFSSGSTWEAPECMKLEMARSFAQAGMLEDALAIRCTSKYAAAAPSCIALQKNNN